MGTAGFLAGVDVESSFADFERRKAVLRKAAGTLGTEGLGGRSGCMINCAAVTVGVDVRLGMDGNDSLRIFSAPVRSRGIVGPGSDGRRSGYGTTAFFGGWGFSSSFMA